MKLTRITITGADDLVDPEALLDLSLEFPYVEWGVLRGGEDRNGTPRYPTPAWVARLRDVIQTHEPAPQWALHLCGSPARHAMAGSPMMFAALNQFKVRPRIQLNGFSKYRLPMLMLAQLMPETEFILQVQQHDAFENVDLLHEQHTNVSVLWDSSGGRGIDDGWRGIPCPTDINGPRFGWAGGITENNIVEKLELLFASNDAPELSDMQFWVDLESGARADDKFDLAKARRILSLAKPFVEAA